MNSFNIYKSDLARTTLLVLGLLLSGWSPIYGEGMHFTVAPDAIAVKGELAALPAGVTDLKFGEFYKMPVGPRGLEPTEKLLRLKGHKVRLVGYMAQPDKPTAGMFHLTPLPVFLGEEDESLADDLPPSTVFVHFETNGTTAPYVPGLISLTGILHIGPQEEPDGRVSAVRLQLDPDLAAALLSNNGKKETSK